MSILLSDHARIEGLWVVDRVPQLDGERILSHTRGCQTRVRGPVDFEALVRLARRSQPLFSS